MNTRFGRDQIQVGPETYDTLLETRVHMQKIIEKKERPGPFWDRSFKKIEQTYIIKDFPKFSTVKAQRTQLRTQNVK